MRRQMKILTRPSSEPGHSDVIERNCEAEDRIHEDHVHLCDEDDLRCVAEQGLHGVAEAACCPAREDIRGTRYAMALAVY